MRCKVGDWAVVTWAVEGHQDCVGKMVEVQCLCPVFKNSWRVKYLNGRPASIAAFVWVSADDRHLLPIRPKDEARTTERELEEV